MPFGHLGCVDGVAPRQGSRVPDDRRCRSRMRRAAFTTSCRARIPAADAYPCPWGQDPSVVDGPTRCPRRFHRVAMEESVPEPRAGHVAPGRAELERVRLPQVHHGREAPSRQPHPHPRGHPWQVLEVECEQTAQQVPRIQDGQAIRLVEVRADSGEPAVRGAADGTRDAIADGVTGRWCMTRN